MNFHSICGLDKFWGDFELHEFLFFALSSYFVDVFLEIFRRQLALGCAGQSLRDWFGFGLGLFGLADCFAALVGITFDH
jgi:hypothetical protein